MLEKFSVFNDFDANDDNTPGFLGAQSIGVAFWSTNGLMIYSFMYPSLGVIELNDRQKEVVKGLDALMGMLKED